MEYICLCSAAFLRRCPEEILSITDVHAWLKQIQKKYPGLISESFNSEFINVSRMTKILQELVREGMSVRDFRQVIESTASYCSSYGLSMVHEGDFDVADIVSYIRLHRKRQTLSKLLSPRGTLKVFTLAPELEEVFVNSRYDSSSLTIAPEVLESVRGGLSEILDPVAVRGVLPVVVLCSAELRHKVSGFLHSLNRDLRVVTFDELDPLVAVEPAGVWQV